eukprot:Rhum_TRINITY_DN14314_c23_g1::Rhum_TRINITY_DN14314_c23_g1_i1::g.80738::m.80738
MRNQIVHPPLRGHTRQLDRRCLRLQRPAAAAASGGGGTVLETRRASPQQRRHRRHRRVAGGSVVGVSAAAAPFLLASLRLGTAVRSRVVVLLRLVEEPGLCDALVLAVQVPQARHAGLLPLEQRMVREPAVVDVHVQLERLLSATAARTLRRAHRRSQTFRPRHVLGRVEHVLLCLLHELRVVRAERVRLQGIRRSANQPRRGVEVPRHRIGERRPAVSAAAATGGSRGCGQSESVPNQPLLQRRREQTQHGRQLLLHRPVAPLQQRVDRHAAPRRTRLQHRTPVGAQPLAHRLRRLRRRRTRRRPTLEHTARRRRRRRRR